MKVVWCYLEKVNSWESKLTDSDVKAYTRKYNFPHYATTSLWLDKKQIVLLSDFTCNVILEDSEKVIQKEIQKMITKEWRKNNL